MATDLELKEKNGDATWYSSEHISVTAVEYALVLLVAGCAECRVANLRLAFGELQLVARSVYETQKI
jgi:hypothetical protein